MCPRTDSSTNEGITAPFTDQLPAVFLSREAAAHSGKLLLGEGHPAAAALARYLDEQPVIRAAQPSARLGLYLHEAGF